MDPRDRIIVALDVNHPDQAISLVTELAPHVGAFKLGLEFITSTLIHLASASHLTDPDLWALRRLFKMLEGKIMWDGKFHDIPNTVRGAVWPLVSHVKMMTVHTLGGAEMMRAAAQSSVGHSKTSSIPDPLILGVTILTSLSYDDLCQLGMVQLLDERNPDTAEKETVMRAKVRMLAMLAQKCGLDGIVCSPKEINMVRQSIGPGRFLIVTPGVRPEWASVGDQKRVMTPAEAIKAGADYLVIGRPITQPPDGMKPADAAKKIADEIAGAP